MFADDVLVDFENTVIVWTLPVSNSISRRSHANGSGGLSAPICLECCTPFPHLCEVRARAEIGRWLRQRQEKAVPDGP